MRPITGRGRELATVVSDLDGRNVIDVLDGRSRRGVERYLRSLPEDARRAIEVVSIDPYEAYRQAIRAELPHARIVCDRFHLVRGANTALDSIRRERLTERDRRRLCALFARDPILYGCPASMASSWPPSERSPPIGKSLATVSLTS
jgi:transposase